MCFLEIRERIDSDDPPISFVESDRQLLARAMQLFMVFSFSTLRRHAVLRFSPPALAPVLKLSLFTRCRCAMTEYDLARFHLKGQLLGVGEKGGLRPFRWFYLVGRWA